MTCLLLLSYCSFFFFFNDTATTEIYTLSLHDALPICRAFTASAFTASSCSARIPCAYSVRSALSRLAATWSHSGGVMRSEEHTSELQSRLHLVCRLLLEKKKKR